MVKQLRGGGKELIRTPNMNSATQDGFTASTDFTPYSGSPYQCFNDSMSSGMHGPLNNYYSYVDLECPKALLIKAFSFIYTGSGSTLTIYGIDDSSNLIELYKKSGTSTSNIYSDVIEANAKYSKYRISITNGSGQIPKINNVVFFFEND